MDDPVYGQVQLDGTTEGSKARYSCNNGFDLIGNSVRKCQSNGRWSGQEPICQRRGTYPVSIKLPIDTTLTVIDCGDLDDPIYGQVQLDGTTEGSKARYSCDDGFILRGDRVRKCQNNGKWSGQEPICESKLAR